ncbi:ester cyclase [Micromonospora sp. KC606]|uniref:ester cyclase n=1 Tax=Micromonospora sp. KC606 TaxID=2530379 RepID=UPI00104E09C0|nr:ester cyclase [Micromonospora sp. KC606]TDC85980.1 ester cyclase [Micromonospora sp. KC606]
MSRETNETTLSRAIAAINAGDVETGVNALFAEGAVDHDPAPGQGPGRAGFLAFFRGLTTAFPDLRLEQRHVTADEDHVSMAFTVSGTHLGDFNGVPPSGRAFKVSGVEIFRFVNGQVVERWGLTDDMGILGQLGLVSLPH